MRRDIPVLFLALLTVGMTFHPCRADVVVSLSDVTIAPGGTGTMDITIYSSDLLTPDTLSQFNIELQITPQNGSGDDVGFSSTVQPVPYGNPNYVFSNESSNSDLSLPFWSPPSTTVYTNDTDSGGDSDDRQRRLFLLGLGGASSAGRSRARRAISGFFGQRPGPDLFRRHERQSLELHRQSRWRRRGHRRSRTFDRIDDGGLQRERALLLLVAQAKARDDNPVVVKGC